ncbi:MAG: hypothetical protein HRU15_00660 [Planctomycetes bacterium]|nr:hypothetical protein [Planctomycetota bacterium]
MHSISIVLLALSGIFFCLSAAVYWRRMVADKKQDLISMLIVGCGMSALTLSVICSLIDNSDHEFSFILLSIWSAVAAILFVKRFLMMPSRGLLVLPVGAVALMCAVISLVEKNKPDLTAGADESLALVVIVHIIFMSLNMASILVAASAAIAYFYSDRQLHLASPRAFELPSLPSLKKVTLVMLVCASAFLFAGMATGAAATTYSESFDYVHPVVVLSLINLLYLLVILFYEATSRIGQRRLSILCIISMLVTLAIAIVMNVSSPYA